MTDCAGAVGMEAPAGTYTAEFIVTRWTPGGDAEAIAGPWIAPVTAYTSGSGQEWISIPLRETSWDQVQVKIADLSPAGPGWLGGSMELLSTSGYILGRRRPCSIFASPCDIGSNTNFGPAFDGFTYTVQARIVSAPGVAR